MKIVRALKAQRSVLLKIEEGFHIDGDPDPDPGLGEPKRRREGRPRLEGSWPLAFVAFHLTPGASLLAWARCLELDEDLARLRVRRAAVLRDDSPSSH